MSGPEWFSFTICVMVGLGCSVFGAWLIVRPHKHSSSEDWGFFALFSGLFSLLPIFIILISFGFVGHNVSCDNPDCPVHGEVECLSE